MADVTVFVPDGEFCSDMTHLGCVYESHESGMHTCTLFGESIGKLQEFISAGEKRRARRKCASCLARMKDGQTHAFKLDEG